MPFIVRELQSRISVDPLVNGKKQEMQALASFTSPPDKCLLVPMVMSWPNNGLTTPRPSTVMCSGRLLPDFLAPASKECF